jgi:prefoldin subunit 5
MFMNSLVELKAKAYDVLAQIEYLQRVLAEVNSQIQNYKEAEEAVVAE